MTPANIAGMAMLNGLNIVALTDHNSAKNCPAFFAQAKKYGIVPIPGMELTTAEDVHVVCLFRSLEDALEQAGLKRKGERRDQTGGGARTYKAWVASLGLIFTQESTNQLTLTLAGEAIMNGESPVAILKNQVLKYQFRENLKV